MKTIIAAFLCAAVVAAMLTPIVRWLARHLNVLDRPHGRKMHERPMPNIGGLAIAAAFYTPLTALLLYHNRIAEQFVALPMKVVGLYVSGLAILALGVYDDVRGATPWQKLIVQTAAGTFLFYCGYQVNALSNPFGDAIQLGWLALPITVAWIVGMINAMNLIDGLDGLAAGVAFFALLAIFSMSFTSGKVLTALFCAALAGALVGFIVYNYNPASIFMGDTGSLFLGFVLATGAIDGAHKSSTAVTLLVPCVALLVPILDTLWAIWRRRMRGAEIMTGDREHIHHKLLKMGFTPRQAVLLLYGVTIVMGLVAVGIYAGSEMVAGVLVMFVVFALVVFVKQMSGPMTEVRDLLRVEDLAPADPLKGLGEALEAAQEATAVWDALTEFGRRSGITGLQLTLHTPGSERGEFTTTTHTWSDDPLEPHLDSEPALRFHLQGGIMRHGLLEVFASHGIVEPTHGSEGLRRLQRVSEMTARALSRLARGGSRGESRPRGEVAARAHA